MGPFLRLAGNAFIRLNHVENLRSDHNAYFARKGPAERRLVETAKICGQPVGHQAPGTYRGLDLLLADPASPLARAADGKPLGLDPAAFP